MLELTINSSIEHALVSFDKKDFQSYAVGMTGLLIAALIVAALWAGSRVMARVNRP